MTTNQNYVPRFDLVGQAWLEDHQENFCKPVMKKLPELVSTPYPTDGSNKYIKLLVEEKSAYPGHLVSMWEEAKRRAAGRTILLPGRDVWLFEVLARLEGTDTIFRPDINSNTKHIVAQVDPDRDRFKECFCIDSCCAGSIPKELKCKDWALGVFSGATDLKSLKAHQLIAKTYPNLQTDPLYLCYAILECIPKYWSHATLDNINRSVQRIEKDGVNFRLAYLTTMVLANHWLETHKDVVKPEIIPEVSIRKTRIRKALSRLKLTRKRRAA